MSKKEALTILLNRVRYPNQDIDYKQLMTAVYVVEKHIKYSGALNSQCCEVK